MNTKEQHKTNSEHQWIKQNNYEHQEVKTKTKSLQATKQNETINPTKIKTSKT